MPLAFTANDEMVDAFTPPAGPVSEIRTAPLGAKAKAKVPGSGFGFTTMGASVPSDWTRKVSMLLVATFSHQEELAVGAEGHGRSLRVVRG